MNQEAVNFCELSRFWERCHELECSHVTSGPPFQEAISTLEMYLISKPPRASRNLSILIQVRVFARASFRTQLHSRSQSPLRTNFRTKVVFIKAPSRQSPSQQ